MLEFERLSRTSLLLVGPDDYLNVSSSQGQRARICMHAGRLPSPASELAYILFVDFDYARDRNSSHSSGPDAPILGRA